MWKSPHDRKLPDFGARVLIMGVLNVTRDSFSDGGKFFSARDALAHAEEMAAAGADIIDVGAESTRPGAKVVGEEEEMEIVVSRIAALRAELDIPISVDTYKPSVALAAVEAGADIINDVYAVRGSLACGAPYPMAAAAAACGAPIVVTCNDRNARKEGDFWARLKVSLRSLIEETVSAGVARGQIAADPGVGFGKVPEENFEIVRRMGELRELGVPLLLGVSRKSFIREVVGPSIPALDAATAAISGYVAANFSADILRVHDVASSVAAVRACSKLFKRKTHG